MEKDTSPLTEFDADCLQERVAGILELVQGFITRARKEMAVQNPVMWYILHNLEANTEP